MSPAPLPTIDNSIAQVFKDLKSKKGTIATTEGITAELKINAQSVPVLLRSHRSHLPRAPNTTCIKILVDSGSSGNLISSRLLKPHKIPRLKKPTTYQIINIQGKPLGQGMTCSLKNVPSVLVLHLERFEFDYETMCCVKNESPVQIPTQLFAKDKKDVIHSYDLYAIANHCGSLSSGHYYADIRSYEDKQWYRFDDSLSS
ncbi:hypothetical protein Q8A67_002964 [Cirrhinus molitorella]|uniref:USP domain-containing protein n=1 Tax=Cirrhinus molitorella TaxID=172907 RepID=A0AA88TVU6_9TELE|nr:hypothetical protein Q8A67_002964 [Cirrhinus molitorella]